MDENALAIRTVGLTRRFGDFVANNDVDLTVRSGERRVLIGPNGAGKTTLFNMLAGQIAPTEGQIFLFEEEVTRLPPEQRSRRGLARTFQLNTLFGGLSVEQNVQVTLAAEHPTRRIFHRRMSHLPEIANACTSYLESWGLADLSGQRVDSLSYGRQRQLEIILALCRKPRVLLLDEPTAGLAREDAEALLGVISSLPEDITVVMIEHDIEIAFQVADAITVLCDGAILAEGKPTEIVNNKAVVEAYLGEALHAAES